MGVCQGMQGLRGSGQGISKVMSEDLRLHFTFLSGLRMVSIFVLCMRVKKALYAKLICSLLLRNPCV